MLYGDKRALREANRAFGHESPDGTGIAAMALLAVALFGLFGLIIMAVKC